MFELNKQLLGMSMLNIQHTFTDIILVVVKAKKPILLSITATLSKFQTSYITIW